MTIKEKDLSAVKKGTMTVDDLLEKYPVKALVTDLIEIINSDKQPALEQIVISPEDFNKLTSLFRIKGYSSTGELETRGRKPKKVVNTI